MDRFSQYHPEEALVSWSGGKDSAYACFLAMRQGLNVRYLASMMTTNNNRLFPHYLTPEIMQAQSDAIGIPLVQQWVTVPAKVTRDKTRVTDYDAKFTDMLKKARIQGVTCGVFGVVSVGNPFYQQQHEWVHEVCRPAEIRPYLPLWGIDRQSILTNIIADGFKAIIVMCDNHRLGKEFLGRVLDEDLLAEFVERHRSTPDGKVGLYHTFVLDGPIFKKRLEVDESAEIKLNDMWYLDIKRFHQAEKSTKEPSIIYQEEELALV
ncbi:diphthine--ammonia ligase [Dehalogenimonas etheniformans]|uniref:ATPase n=1 Tax=Dehalogenimonas etheniformans TaxID=1536648 RepID=A0A2P5P6X2_9CHLR|nr:diphthine--ammonia ligase [Dehalogenimonas etheniformans]PPD58056.1 ATPase [Dehalogenimonas etheniformans]QNT75405.1 diphthine--ammonia ligase [Dehalogenimonas etheniformans]